LHAPKRLHHESFFAGHVAYIRAGACSGCGECAELCRFGAILNPESQNGDGVFSVDPIACEGCGVCAHFCPERAIELQDCLSGEWFVSKTKHGPLVHARLAVAGENSGKLVSHLRKTARDLAAQKRIDLVIADGSPGIGCPVIASITGSDLVLAVTEPTLSGLHDLNRIAELVDHFRIPMVVMVNKSDLNKSITSQILDFSRERGFKVVGRIPYSDEFTEAMIAGLSIVELGEGPASQAVSASWQKVQAVLIH
jgi:MinD superfamily P-loop ATPase